MSNNTKSCPVGYMVKFGHRELLFLALLFSFSDLTGRFLNLSVNQLERCASVPLILSKVSAIWDCVGSLNSHVMTLFLCGSLSLVNLLGRACVYSFSAVSQSNTSMRRLYMSMNVRSFERLKDRSRIAYLSMIKNL